MKNLVFVFTVVFAFQTASAQATWRIVNGSSEHVQSGKSYYLQVIKNGWHLKYKSREYGINLGWGKQAMPNIKFEKSGGGKINCGDQIAVFVENGGYLRYKSRKWGINLVWSETPVYEWELRTLENKQGTPVMSDLNVGLYNGTTRDFVRNCKRAGLPVVDLAWVIDCPKGWRVPDPINGLVKTLTRKDIDLAIKYGSILLTLL